jgi:hypothetical protein
LGNSIHEQWSSAYQDDSGRIVGEPEVDYPPCSEDAQPSGAGFNADPIIDSRSNALLGAQVSFCGLNGDVAEQELDLLQLATGCLA